MVTEIILFILEIVGTIAFAVSGAFTFCSHMAFTIAFPGGGDYLFPMIVGKLISGVASILLAFLLYKKLAAIKG